MQTNTLAALSNTFAGRPLIPHSEAAAALLISARTLRGLGDSGEIVFTRVGKCRRAYTIEDLAAYIERPKQCPSTCAKTSTRRSGTTVSKSTGDGFMAALDARKRPTQKHLSVVNGSKPKKKQTARATL